LCNNKWGMHRIWRLKWQKIPYWSQREVICCAFDTESTFSIFCPVVNCITYEVLVTSETSSIVRGGLLVSFFLCTILDNLDLFNTRLVLALCAKTNPSLSETLVQIDVALSSEVVGNSTPQFREHSVGKEQLTSHHK
jgi:hypothetical protein